MSGNTQPVTATQIQIDQIESSMDAVVPFHVDALDARGRAILLGPALDAVLSRHDYPEPVANLLGEMMVLTVLLGTSLKFDGKFIVQAHTDGPVSLLVVDFRTPSDVRAYAQYDEEAVAKAAARGDAAPNDLLGKGTLALTVDQGQYMNRYQGIVQLDGATLEEIAKNYFRQSEQIPTEIRLAVGRLSTRNDDGTATQNWRAGGVLAQFLPDSMDRIANRDLHPGDAPDDAAFHEVDEDDAWAEVKALIGTVENDELLDENIGIHRLLYRLFHERGVIVYQAQKIEEKCTCSDEKLETVLRSLSAEERADAAQDGVITVTCEFCSTKRVFDASQFD